MSVEASTFTQVTRCKPERSIHAAFQDPNKSINQHDEIDQYLHDKGVEAITYDADTITLSQAPGRASIYEEFFHAQQYLDGRNDGADRSMLICKIEARNYLFPNAKKLNLSISEVALTKHNLTKYGRNLDALDSQQSN